MRIFGYRSKPCHTFPGLPPFLSSLALTALHRTPSFPKQILLREDNPRKDINVMVYWLHVG